MNRPTIKLPAQAEIDALRRLAEAVRRDSENYTCGPAAKQALAEYEALKR